MIRKRYLKKVLAAFLLITILGNVVAPTVSYALTSGPTAPEATSFEPVDTTDMVNLLTGDMTYNVPLLEVPGPSGGYPLSLSYHAGIQPGEDASWVGLGFTLNPGSIHRSVNGFPDDHNGVTTSDRVYWAGGETDTYSVGVSVGINGLASVDAGLSYSVDTYKGVGVGGYVGASVGLGNSPFHASANIGISPYGGAYLSAGLGLTAPIGKGQGMAFSLGGHTGITTNFQSVSYNSGVGLGMGWGKAVRGHQQNISLMGASIASSSNGNSVSQTASGISQSVNNSKNGKISTSSSGFNLSIPVFPGVSISYGEEHVRYWMDETESVSVFGALYPPSPVPFDDFNKKAFDTYSLQDPSVDTSIQSDPNFTFGPSFMNHDDYFVNAQGLGGIIRPHVFKETLFRQNRKKQDGTYDIVQYQYLNEDYNTDRVEFRFENDFSNRHLTSNEGWAMLTTLPSYPISIVRGTSVTGEPNSNGTPQPNEGIQGNLLASSRHIEWYTNDQIKNHNTDGLIETISTGFDRNSTGNFASQIGAFKITNETGVTYHFSLPVYAYKEYEYSENTKYPSGQNYNEFKKPEHYAYTWYLTAITGPDFVDRSPTGNADGKLSSDDWGYWVEFEYGKWTDSFAWRNPETGFHVDLDNDFRNYSSGVKELYYLDAVRTKTHTALFLKDIRYDGMGVSQFSDASHPAGALKLNSIVLAENKKINDFLSSIGRSNLKELKSVNTQLDISYNEGYMVYDDDYVGTMEYRSIPFLFGKNVFDTGDFESLNPSLLSIATRSIDFTFNPIDNSLCPETTNSYKPSDVYTDNAVNTSASVTFKNYGKLTLESVSFNGKSGASLIPPIQFGYELDNPASGYSYLRASPRGDGDFYITQPNSGLEEGDIIKFSSNNIDYYGLVSLITNDQLHGKIIGNNIPINSTYVSWKETKNPPYQRDFYDEWGLYKPDYQSPTTNVGGSRKATRLSCLSSDVWSLRGITSSLGSKISIEYEPDDYSSSVLQNNLQKLSVISSQLLSVEQIANFVPIVHFRLFIDTEGTDLTSIYNVGNASCAIGGKLPELGAPQVISTFYIENVTKNYIDVSFSSTEPTIQSYCGVIFYQMKQNVGGIRVQSVSVSNFGETQITKYSYSLNGLSTGVTSYEPDLFDRIPSTCDPTVSKFVKGILNRHVTKILQNTRIVPMPGVMYEYVTVSESVDNGNGEVNLPTKSRYHFQTLKKQMIDLFTESQFNRSSSSGSEQPGVLTATQSVPYSTLQKKVTLVRNLTAWVGKLKSITLLDSNENWISQTINNYVEDEVLNNLTDQTTTDQIASRFEDAHQQFSQLGMLQEATWDARVVKNDQGTHDFFAGISKNYVYPSFQVGQTNINYKTGSTSTTTNLSFDFYSGQATSTLSADGYGNTFLTETIPAYRKYSEMGLAINGGANMLTQQAANYTYKVTSDYASNPIVANKLGLVSASAQTWSNDIEVLGAGVTGEEGIQPSIWRMKGSHSFVGNDNTTLGDDGLYPMNSFTPFADWISNGTTSGWQKNSEITLYDTYSHALEAMDLNENYAATVMTQDQARVAATAANTRYDEIGYSGAEDKPKAGRYGGLLDLGSNMYTLASNGASWSQQAAHSGSSSLLATAGQQAFIFYTGSQNNSYHVSVWSTRPDAIIRYQLEGSVTQIASLKNQGSANGWYLLEADITNVSGYDDVSIWCESGNASTYFDDFRVHPVKAAMTSYVYNQWGELSHILNANNLYTKYEYDGMGRLIRTYQETLSNPLVLMSETTYHYANH